MGYDAALAASLARDLSAHPGLSKGLESFVTGWLSLKNLSQVSRLTSWQKDSLVKLMSGMTSQVEELFKNY
jgi:hypothetical protein